MNDTIEPTATTAAEDARELEDASRAELLLAIEGNTVVPVGEEEHFPGLLERLDELLGEVLDVEKHAAITSAAADVMGGGEDEPVTGETHARLFQVLVSAVTLLGSFKEFTLGVREHLRGEASRPSHVDELIASIRPKAGRVLGALGLELDTIVTSERTLLRPEWKAGQRVRAALDVDYITEDFDVMRGTPGVVREMAANGCAGLARVTWLGGRTVVTSLDCLEPVGDDELARERAELLGAAVDLRRAVQGCDGQQPSRLVLELFLDQVEQHLAGAEGSP